MEENKTKLVQLLPKKYYQEPDMTEWTIGVVQKKVTSELMEQLTKFLPLSSFPTDSSNHLKRVSVINAPADSVYVLLMPLTSVPVRLNVFL